MNPGKLDRRISIEVRTLTEDDTMSRVETWAEEAAVWAQIIKHTGKRGVVADAERTSNMKTFRIRTRTITPTTHRVTYKGETFKIEAIEEIGRENLLDLVCTSYESIE